MKIQKANKMTIEEKVLICDHCDEEVEECDSCGKKFKNGQKIFCFEGEGGSHFCSEKCADTFLNGWTHEVVPAETYSI